MIQSTGINQTFDKRVNRCKDDLQGGGSSTTPSLTSQLHPLHPKNIPQPLISPYRKQQGLPHVGRGFRGSESCVFYPVLAASLQLPASISEFLTDTQLFPASHLLSPPPPSFPLHLSLRPPTGRTKRQMEDEEEVLTAQRSVEDAEELERERRRRVRESYCWTDGGSMPGETSPEDGMPAEESISPSMEEDEGFSDWTQRRERRRQQRLQELSQGGEEEEEEENRKNKSAAVKSVQTSVTSSSRLQRQEHHQEDDEEEERVEMERRKNQEEEEFNRAQRMRREKEEEEEKRKREEVTIRRKEGVQKPKEVEKRKEVKISYTSKVFLNQEAKKQRNGDATKEEVTTIKNQKTKRSTRGGGGNQELTELKMKREERRRVREEEECRREEEEHQKLAKEEEEDEGGHGGRRRVEASERMKSRSSSSVDGDEMFSPFSPKPPKVNITCSYMLLQYCCVPGFYCRNTASHCRHINSFKKTQPLGLLIKIDDKREQYAHAVENSQEARAVKASLSDLPGSPEVVSSKKNLFEAGETWSPSRGPAARTLRVEGGRGQSDHSVGREARRCDAEKNMWEIIGDSTGDQDKGSAAGKKYKFVVTGHGKYEKIPVDEDGEEFADGEDGETQTQFSNM
ncbi:hypothetical protein F7725_023440 [Dissostichus mawsoni]|uniref:Uncharacterized protein n=1 Tax=Dissostichus mawsoni TaxID=36200 RepID=A0A7J5Z0R5_DISMA|nr:hypothetical protein F7725_023440 [Dissostichus mawsoni]